LLTCHLVSIYGASRVSAIVGLRQKVWVKAIQQRVSITSSMLGSMKSVKMMGLSDHLFDSIQKQRVRELDLSKRFRVLGMFRMILCKVEFAPQVISLTLIAFVPSIIGPTATFVIFAIEASVKGSNQLSISQTFSSLIIITLLTTPAENFLQSLPQIAMSVGCLERIQGFLLSESCDDHRIIPENPSSDVALGGDFGEIELANFDISKTAEHAVLVQNAVIRPSPDAPPAINDIDFNCRSGSLTMVVGVVGSGKSTLLRAIAGELQCSQGYITTTSKNVAFCSQTPWLPNASVRDIVCGYSSRQERDQAWYDSVLHAVLLMRT
jgi:ATP-binding cassette, subfamily C (CFTR/MRP), member 1